jgi:hypothetical protein
MYVVLPYHMLLFCWRAGAWGIVCISLAFLEIQILLLYGCVLGCILEFFGVFMRVFYLVFFTCDGNRSDV